MLVNLSSYHWIRGSSSIFSTLEIAQQPLFLLRESSSQGHPDNKTNRMCIFRDRDLF